MSDELLNFQLTDNGGYHGIQEEMFGWHTWQQDVGLNAEGNSRGAEDADWNIAYHSINTCNMILDAIDDNTPKTRNRNWKKIELKEKPIS